MSYRDGNDEDDEVDPSIFALLSKSLNISSSSPSAKSHPSTGVLSSARFITDNAIDVAISSSGAKSAAAQIHTLMRQRQYSTQSWALRDLHPKPKDGESTLNFIFAMDLLNFSFWSEREEEERFSIEYRGKRWTGYWSLVAGLQRALDEGIPIVDSHFWHDHEGLTASSLQHVFRSATSEPIPMLRERLECMREAGQVLYEKYSCAFANCVAAAEQSAASLVNILVRDFPCLRDEHMFEGENTHIYKRAQIIVADIWACFNGQGYGSFHDISSLTMFADYRIPQMLSMLGVLLYSPSLEGRIRRGEQLQCGEVCEIELRGCSIWAVELIRREIVDGLSSEEAAKINSVLIDTFLYDTLKEKEARGEMGDAMPHHKTRSIWY